MKQLLFVSFLWGVCLLLPCGSRCQAQEIYLYQRAGFGESGELSLAWESAVGTREARPFGEKGIEQGVRSRLNVTDSLSLEVWGGLLIDAGDGQVQNGAFSAEANLGVLRQEKQAVNLSLGVGFVRDFQSVSIPRFRATVSRDWGALNVTVAGLAEVPLAEERDEVDLIAGLGTSYQVSKQVRVGLEAVGEDLEGFWEDDEAEGGAKVVIGPTVQVAGSHHLAVKANAGAVLLASTNDPSLSPGEAAPSPTGFLGRLSVAYVF